MFKIITRNMSNKNVKKATMAKKLSRVQELQSNKDAIAEVINEVPDIEDTIPGEAVVKSVFFSPLQTRRQRLANGNARHKQQLNDFKQETAKPSEPKIFTDIASKKKDIKIELPLIAYGDNKDVEKIEKDLKIPPWKPNKRAQIYSTVNSNNEPPDCGAIFNENSNSEQSAEKEEVDVVGKFKSPSNKTVISSEAVPKAAVKTDPVWEPLHWRQVFENVRQMRATTAAPVDTMGCQACADKDSDDKTQRFHKLLALMLSSQTKDETTFEAMQRLKVNTSSLTPQAIVAMETKTLEQLLCPVSFYKTKAKNLQNTARILIDKYEGDIPNNIKELVALPGVGPKMAHICMSTAWNEITGIGVDVHVHRISNRLGWLQRETKEPEQTRAALEAWLPRELWHDVNYLLVGFGQTICTPVRPKCAECLNNEICPSAFKATPRKKHASGDDKKTPTKKPKQTPKKENTSFEEAETSQTKTKTKARPKKNIQL